MQLTVFIAATCVIIAACLFVALMVIHRKDDNSKMAATISLAALVNLGYLGNLLAGSYRMMSICNSVYFFSIDLMLMALLYFIDDYTRAKKTKLLRVLRCSAILYCIFDGVGFLFNALQDQGTEWWITYVRTGTATLYSYEAHLPFTLHLTFSYLMISYVLFRLIYHSVVVTKAYRRRFTSMLAGIFIIVGLNAVYLFFAPEDLPDISLILYGVMSIVLYVQVYHYSHKGMIVTAGITMLQNMSSPYVMFDYEDHYCLSNQAADFLIPPEKRNNSYTLTEMLADTGMAELVDDPDKDCAFLWTSHSENGHTIYRGDMSLMRDEKGRLIGRMLALTDNSLDIDLLTGFFSRSSFERYFSNNSAIAYPASVMILDLNRLSYINDHCGRLAGDQAIRLLSELMRRHLGADTYFARLGDANLLALCPGMDGRNAHDKLDAIRKDLCALKVGDVPLDMQSAVDTVTEANPDILQAANKARESMRIRKLLDHTSAHASLLDSLARTQMENDPTTENHVRRTQEAGEWLGRRIGLSDVDLSNLSLLCLVHDIGKLGIPLEILNKPGRLSPEEWRVMASHVDKGYNICMASEELRGVAGYVLHHHESWDGSGYPDHLAGDAIPVLCRIIAVVDAYDAMTNDRPYRQALPRKKAMEELRACAGRQFDPNVVSEYLALLQENETAAGTEEETQRDLIRPGGIQNVEGEPAPEIIRVHDVRFSAYQLDETGRIIAVDDLFSALTGYTREDVETYHLRQFDLIPPEDLDEYRTRVGYDRDRAVYLEHRLLRKDRAVINVYCYGRAFYSAAVHALRTEIIICDASASMAVREMMERMQDSHNRAISIYQERLREDPLTGLLNQRAFREDVQLRLLDDTTGVMMMILDIDHFKHYNDTRGHHHGDELLRRVGQVMSSLNSGQVETCRLGGDEFAVAFYDEEGRTDVLRERSEKFWNALLQGTHVFESNMTFSGGIACAKKGMTYLTLFDFVDRLLYDAKAAGRNQLVRE